MQPVKFKETQSQLSLIQNRLNLLTYNAQTRKDELIG